MKKLALLLAAVAMVSCGEGTPTAPTGTVLTISASPSQIALRGTSTIRVVGRRPDGNPVEEGTEIRLSTTLGTLPAFISATSSGEALTTLTGDGRPGTATVTATVGADIVATIDVQIGEATESQPTLLVNINPDNIPVLGTATVTVTARETDGTPVEAGRAVFLTTTLGSLRPAEPTTDSNGRATSTLTAAEQAGEATITAILGTSEAVTANLTIRDAASLLSLQAIPATIPQAGGTTDLVATVLNAQGEVLQGVAVTFTSDLGTLSPAGAVITNNSGQARTTLTLTEDEINGLPPGARFVTATARTTTQDRELTETFIIRVE